MNNPSTQGCLLLCKDKNFKANHNQCVLIVFQLIDVCYYAKIRILKQITTTSPKNGRNTRCLLLCKDKNFKANHNPLEDLPFNLWDVCYYAKIRILKQITTRAYRQYVRQLMFVIMQR